MEGFREMDVGQNILNVGGSLTDCAHYSLDFLERDDHRRDGSDDSVLFGLRFSPGPSLPESLGKALERGSTLGSSPTYEETLLSPISSLPSSS